MSNDHLKAIRSYNMSRIKGKGTRPEETVRKYLFSQGFRYRKNVEKLPGKPDIVLPKYKTVVFVNGCFWHHHDCRYFVWPRTNADFWRNKINRNAERDKENINKLQTDGWNTIIVWECALKNNKEDVLKELAASIRANEYKDNNGKQNMR